ncbi:hypothetical protein PYCC9005_000737 [Savitreella phatthalungensis]
MTTSAIKLFVGGLSWGTTDAILFDEFSKHGVIEEAIVVRDKLTGKSRGFGFVRFQQEQDAQKAKEITDGQLLDGRVVRVDFASEKRRPVNTGPGMTSLASGLNPMAHGPSGIYDPAGVYGGMFLQTGPGQSPTSSGWPGPSRGYLSNGNNAFAVNPYMISPIPIGMYGSPSNSTAMMPAFAMSQSHSGQQQQQQQQQQQYQQHLHMQQMQAIQAAQQHAFYQQHASVSLNGGRTLANHFTELDHTELQKNDCDRKTEGLTTDEEPDESLIDVHSNAPAYTDAAQ